MEAFDKAIQLGEQTPDVYFNRAQTLLALSRWDEGCVALDKAFGHNYASAGYQITGNTEEIISNLFTDTRDKAVWRTRITRLIELYKKHCVLSALGQGLVRGISTLNSPMISEAEARMWLKVWEELAGNCIEFQVPLRLLSAVVRYREKHDQRVLLALPIEERTLLEEQVLKMEEFERT